MRGRDLGPEGPQDRLSRMARYLITDAAKADVRAILAYLRARSPRASKQVRLDRQGAFRRLAQFPFIGHTRADVPQAGVRFWSVYSYLVIYRPESKPVQIIRV